MKLKLVKNYNDKHKAGKLVEIDNIMRAPDKCASGVMVRVVGVFARPRWLDLGWFVPDPEDRPTHQAAGRPPR